MRRPSTFVRDLGQGEGQVLKALERAFREARRRTRPMSVYVNAVSADRIMFGVTEEMNEPWRGAPQLAPPAG